MHWSAHLVKKVWNQNNSFKKSLVIAFRAASIQSQHDVFLINDLATASHFTFIKNMFPSSCVAVCFHGMPLPGVYSGYMKDKDLIFSTADLVFANTQYSHGILQSLNCPEGKIRIVPVGLDILKLILMKKKFIKKIIYYD